MSGRKAVVKPRVVDALQMANGNWLVEDGNDRRVYLPDEFNRLFEVTPPDCCMDQFSSRMCERGTRGCTVEHGSDP